MPINDQDPVINCDDLTPNDTTNFTKVYRGFYVGGSGNIKIRTFGDNDVTLNNIAVGVPIPIKIKRVFSTGTTATNIVGLE